MRTDAEILEAARDVAADMRLELRPDGTFGNERGESLTLARFAVLVAARVAEFDESKVTRDERGRFGEGTSTGTGAQVEGHAGTADIVTMSSLPPAKQAQVEGKIEGPVPPPKPGGGWPRDADGKPIVPQPPEGKSWGLGVSKEDAIANLEANFARAQADPDVMEGGKNWYGDVHDEAAQLGEKYGYGIEETAGCLAAMSAGTDWESEMGIMTSMMRLDGTELQVSDERLGVINEKLEKMGLDTVTNGVNFADLDSRTAVQLMFEDHQTNRETTGGNWGVQHSFSFYERGLEMLRGDLRPEELNGVKVREFYNNISNPGVADHTTIDVMMMRIAANNPAISNDTRITGSPAYQKVNVGPTPWLADQIRTIADREGLRSNQVQAIMWLQWKKDREALT